MSDVRKRYEALRDEHERLARQAERDMLNPEFSPDEQRDAMEMAKVRWQMSRDAADTVANAADAHPKQFRGTNAGIQGKTNARLSYLRETFKGSEKQEWIAAKAMDDPLAQELWNKQGEGAVRRIRTRLC